MAFKRKNRWDVQVVFPRWAFGIKRRTDVDQTPEAVCEELEEFCTRVRRAIADQQAKAERAVAPTASEAQKG